MKLCYKLSCLVAVILSANANGIPVSQRRHFDVVSHAFCGSSVSDEEKVGKKTLEEIHTYAELKHDPRAPLPDSFTICSSIMTTNCPSPNFPSFFTILDNEGAQFLSPTCNHGATESLLLAPQSGAHTIAPHRDPIQPIPSQSNPLIALEQENPEKTHDVIYF